MVKTILNALCLIVALLFFAGCGSEPAAPSSEPASTESAPQSNVKTSGVLEIDGVPLEAVTFIEVATVQGLGEETLARLKLQRELFELKITGEPFEVELEEGIAIKRSDALALTEQLKELAADFPPILAIDQDLGNNRLRKLRSDSGLHKEYAFLFNSITVMNLERAIGMLDEKVQVDLKMLDAIYASNDEDRSRQARHDLKWLEQVHGQLKAYLPIATELIQAKLKYTSIPVAQKNWEAFTQVYSAVMSSNIYARCLGAVEAVPGEPFEVLGKGQLIVRLDFDEGPAYFMPGSDGETRVTVSNLQVIEE